jgi:hypothetical protein
MVPTSACNKMVGTAGFKPATSCAQGRRAIRLRYVPNQVGEERIGITGKDQAFLTGYQKTKRCLFTIFYLEPSCLPPRSSLKRVAQSLNFPGRRRRFESCRSDHFRFLPINVARTFRLPVRNTELESPVNPRAGKLLCRNHIGSA